MVFIQSQLLFFVLSCIVLFIRISLGVIRLFTLFYLYLLFFIIFFFFFFVFMQKTAYELRIIDWSSDVCSSDLAWAYYRQALCCKVGYPKRHKKGNSGSLPTKTGRPACLRPGFQASQQARALQPDRTKKAGTGRSRYLACAHNEMIRTLLIAPIRFYRYFLSPWVGRSCRFTPTCSLYAIEAIEKHGALKGLWLASRSEEHTSELQSQMRISYA